MCEDIKCCVAKEQEPVALLIPNTGTVNDFEVKCILSNVEKMKTTADKYNIFDILNQPIEVYFGDNKVATTNLNILMIAIEEIHKASSKKHPLYDWERHVNEEIDNTVSCNFGAMFRHLYKIHQGETIDTESNCPHWAHFACRWQMAVTSALRLTANGLYRTYNVNGIVSQIDGIYDYISPETIYVLGHMSKQALIARMHAMLEYGPDTRNREMMSVLCQKGSLILNILTGKNEFTNKKALTEIFELSNWVIAHSLISAGPAINDDKPMRVGDDVKPWDCVKVF